MATLEYFRNKIEHSKDLLSVVKTMKAMAAVSIRQYEEAVKALANYSHTIDMGLQILLLRQPRLLGAMTEEHEGAVAAVVFGSDLGMCGQFNQDIATFVQEATFLQEKQEPELFFISMGERIDALLRSDGWPVRKKFWLPGSVKGITSSVQDILFQLEAWREEHELAKIVLFFNKKLSGSTYEPNRVQLWPLDPEWLNVLANKKWPSTCLPDFRSEPRELLAAVVQQFFFVMLYQAFAESLASENASRLAAMQAAEKNINEHLEELTTQFNHERQSSITSELLDIVSGFEALES